MKYKYHPFVGDKDSLVHCECPFQLTAPADPWQIDEAVSSNSRTAARFWVASGSFTVY